MNKLLVCKRILYYSKKLGMQKDWVKYLISFITKILISNLILFYEKYKLLFSNI